MPTPTYPMRYRCKYGAPDVITRPEAASQVFNAPGFVILDTDGNVATAIASGNNYVSSDTPILGAALADASGTSLTDIPVMLAEDNVEFLLPLASADSTAKTQVGVGYQLEHTAEGLWSVDVDDTTSPVVIVTEIDPTDAVGTARGWVWVRFIRAEVDFAEST